MSGGGGASGIWGFANEKDIFGVLSTLWEGYLKI